MRISSSELALLRDSKSHYSDLFLSIFQPKTVLQAQVNGSISRGERAIPYDSVSSGSWQSVRTGATLLVGSSAGARDVGKVRIKSITSSVITVAENSHIKWANDLYLTVLDYFDVWPVYPRIIQDPSNSEEVIFYKDYDITYTNQNTVLGAFMNIGPHRAGFDGEQLYYSASGTYALSGAISTVEWAFEGGTPTGSSLNTPGYVTYNTPGHYLTRCTVSGTNGWIETGYRYVSVYDKPSEGTDIPVQKWELSDLSGSRGEAGYRGTITVYEPVTVEEGSIVVLFADEWYGSVNQSIGGNAPNAQKIKFVGYVLNNSIRYNYKESSVSFEVGSLSQVMKEIEGFSVSVESKASPTTWYELNDMDGKKAAYHYLKWHSNVISLADIEWIGTDYPIQYFDSDRESLFDAIDNFLRTTFIASAVNDRQGKLYLETDAYATPNATGTFSSVFDITKNDWLDTPEITENRYPPVSYIEFGGIHYSGVSTGTFSPLMAEAPGSAPAYRGKVDRRQGLALGGQAQVNQLVGDVFAHENAQFPTMDLPFRGNYSNLDIAPQEAHQVNIAADDTARGQAISGLYVPNNLVWTFNPEDKVLMVRGGLNVLTSGEAGTTIVIPEVVDDGGYGGRRTGLTIPTISLPSLPSSASVYSALKLSGNTLTNLDYNTPFNLPLTTIDFSTEDSSLGGGTASGTFSGQNIVPIVGASGTYGVNYGFMSSLPGIYRVGFTFRIISSSDDNSGQFMIQGDVVSNTLFPGLSDSIFRQSVAVPYLYSSSITGQTILKLPANGIVTIEVKSFSTWNHNLSDRSAYMEFLKYEP